MPHNRKAPSTGTKVDPGRNAPVTQEGAGFVGSGSLAAESNREGGKFSENRATQTETTSFNSGMGSGKNLDEGGFDDSRITDGLKKALESEPGSMDDPSRLAELKMERNAAAVVGVTGRKDQKWSTRTAFDGLDRETSS